LPPGLVTELLPTISVPINPRLAARRLPSALVDELNRSSESPFQGLIRRTSSSTPERRTAVVTDSSLVFAIEESLNSPAGCLFPYRNVATGETDVDGIWALLVCFWGAVRDVFPEAWGKKPTQSRLMHGVGIRSMGRLMDRMMSAMDGTDEATSARVHNELG